MKFGQLNNNLLLSSSGKNFFEHYGYLLVKKIGRNVRQIYLMKFLLIDSSQATMHVQKIILLTKLFQRYEFASQYAEQKRE